MITTAVTISARCCRCTPVASRRRGGGLLFGGGEVK